MQISGIPAKFSIPFANSAGGAYIRVIPTASQIGITNGAASLTDGFPPLTFLAVGAGGVPPFGQDFNGILNQITLWSQFQGAGGVPQFDGTFSTAIGGYPQGAILSSTTPGVAWLSTADNNTTNPDTGGAANWIALLTSFAVQSGAYVSWDDTGSANAVIITPVPAIASYAKYQRFYIKLAASITGASVININGLGNVALTRADQTATQAGDGFIGEILEVIYDGTQFQIQGLLTSAQPPANIQVFSSAATTNFTVPAGVTKILARAWGGGGGSGGAAPNSGGSGGGGGGFTQKLITGLVPGTVISITVGAGGGAGGSPSAGGTGGTSAVGAFCSAAGGAGGPASSAAGSAGGIATGGDQNITGQIGNGGSVISTSAVIAGAGGSSPNGAPGAPPGITSNTSFAGRVGSQPGGGAAGAAAYSSGTNQAGAAGGVGQVILQW